MSHSHWLSPQTTPHKSCSTSYTHCSVRQGLRSFYALLIPCVSPASDARSRTCVAGSDDQRLTSAWPLGPSLGRDGSAMRIARP